MNIKTITYFVLFSCITSSIATAAPDPGASTIRLEKDCGADPNCLTTVGSLMNWIWNTRTPSPSAASPLLVLIGPGEFSGSPLACTNAPFMPNPNLGHVTYRGAGRKNTVISHGFFGAVSTNCDNMVFESMTLKGGYAGVGWFLGGSSTWTNVEMIGGYYGWLDANSSNRDVCSDAQGRHEFFSSSIVAEGIQAVEAFQNRCGKNWLWGSEISIHQSALKNKIVGVSTIGSGNELHLYGSNLRVTSDVDTSTLAHIGIEAIDSGNVHVHGTGIDVVSVFANEITALSAVNGGLIHASESAYVLNNGVGGLTTRVSNVGGTVHAPHMWAQGATPPQIESENGADTMVITNTADGQPHLVIYSESCTSSKWFDVVTGSCL